MNHPTELLPDYAASLLPDPAAVAAHLESCQECAADAESWYKVHEAVRERAAEVAAPSPAIFAAIRARIGTADVASDPPPSPPVSSEVSVPPVRAAGPIPRYASVIGQRPWRRALGLLARQRTLVRWPVWAVAVAVLMIGAAVAALLASVGLAPHVLATVVPLTAALAIAGACRSDADPAAELVAATPTSPRVVLLARLALVLGTVVTGGMLVTLVLAPLVPAVGVLGLAAAWFGPLVPLSALNFALSVLWRPSAGVGVAMALWLLRALSSVGEIDMAMASLIEPLWAPGGGMFAGAAVLVAVTVLLSPHLPWRHRRTAGF